MRQPRFIGGSDALLLLIFAYDLGRDNGLEGTRSIFGDLALSPAVQVELIDDRNPSKNGVYLVEEVVTTFGMGGYRQKLSIPYKIKEKETYGNG